MNWLLIALAPPAIFAVSNYLDKYLLEKYFKHQGNGALVIFSSLISVITLPFILIFARGVLDIAPLTAVLTMTSGILYVLALLPYFKAMREDDASVVAPLFQFIPVFGYVLGYFLLGESLNPYQIGAGLLVLLGGFGLALDLAAEEFSVKWSALLLMLLSSLLMALNSVVFKLFALEQSYWVTSFWGDLGMLSVGLAFLALSPVSRREFSEVFRRNSGPALALNASNEVINIVGMFILNYALLLAPVAFIFLAGSAQPLFVLAYGVLLTLLFPKVIEENIERKVLLQKLASIAVLVLGAFLMDLAS